MFLEETERFRVISLKRLPCLALASSGDETLVQDIGWVPSSTLQRRNGTTYYLPSYANCTPCLSSALTAVIKEARLFAGAAHSKVKEEVLISKEKQVEAMVFRDLLSAEDRKEIHLLAADCLQNQWGTVRRRSVGLGSAWRAPTNTLIRLSARFASLMAAHKLQKPGFVMKQADYLIYAPDDAAGWHDHAGESLWFLVALLNSDFTGGHFFLKDYPSSNSLDVPIILKVGDVIFCKSHLEHRVSPVLSGTRISLNLDFWHPATAATDRRSDHDRS